MIEIGWILNIKINLQLVSNFKEIRDLSQLFYIIVNYTVHGLKYKVSPPGHAASRMGSYT